MLDGQDLRVAPGEIVALVAPSGTGKSTLLRTLVRLEPLEAGTVALDGVDVTHIPAPVLRRRVGLVPQAPAMLPGSVADNVRYGIDGEPDVTGALEAAGLDPAMAAREAAGLSGGEQMRVALARALARRPQTLLLDEPTAALDPEAAERVGASLRRLADRGVGICVATHDAAFAGQVATRRVGLA